MNFKQDWGRLALECAVAVVIQFVIIKILGALFGSQTGILSFLRDELFLGFLVSLGLCWSLVKEYKVELGEALLLTLGVLGVIDLLAFVLYGPHGFHWRASIFCLECAPMGVFMRRVYLGWKKCPENPESHKRIEYDKVGKFQRGVQLVAGGSGHKAFETLTKQESPEDSRAGISIWNSRPFPYSRENQHFLITGSPGAGKTQIIYPMIDQVYKRPNDKAIIWDIKGTFIQAYAGHEGVDLLAAWDKRSIAWSPGADIRSQLDCQQVASIMFPSNPRDSQPFFLNSARQILEAIFVYLDFQGNDWGWGDVWSILSMDKKAIAKLLSTFEDGNALANVIGGESKATEDIYSTLIGNAQQTIRWYAKAWPKGKVSLRKWVHGNSKFLIIGGIPERVDLAQSTANIAVEIITNEILSLPDDPNRRIWLFLDELATLGKLTALLNAFSLGRSKGLCVVAGIQDIGKLEHYYGATLAKSIANTFSTMIFLRCSDNDTAQWASRTLGEQDVMISQESSGSSNQGVTGKTTHTHSKQEVLKTRPLFLPSEITNFENLTGVIRASGWPLVRARWLYKEIPQDQPLVDEADWLKRKDKAPEKPLAEQTPMSSWRLE